MSTIPDVRAPSNPYQATSLGDLITSNQLHWLSVAAESLGLDKDQTAQELFNCSVFSLSRSAANQLEPHFARLKMLHEAEYQHTADAPKGVTAHAC